MRCYYWLVGKPITHEQDHEYYGVNRHFSWERSEENWDDSPAIEVWKDYCCADWDMDEEWDDFFPTLDAAKGFQSRFGEFGYSFVIIAVYPCASAEDVAEAQALPGFIGLDVANTDPSSVLYPRAVWMDFGPNEDPLAALWDIGSKYARLRINQYGLLSDYEDAALLRDVGHALEIIDKTNHTPRNLQIMAIQQIAG